MSIKPIAPIKPIALWGVVFPVAEPTFAYAYANDNFPEQTARDMNTPPTNVGNIWDYNELASLIPRCDNYADLAYMLGRNIPTTINAVSALHAVHDKLARVIANNCELQPSPQEFTMSNIENRTAPRFITSNSSLYASKYSPAFDTLLVTKGVLNFYTVGIDDSSATTVVKSPEKYEVGNTVLISSKSDKNSLIEVRIMGTVTQPVNYASDGISFIWGLSPRATSTLQTEQDAALKALADNADKQYNLERLEKVLGVSLSKLDDDITSVEEDIGEAPRSATVRFTSLFENLLRTLR